MLPSLSLRIHLPRVISTLVLRERADEDNDDPLLSAGRRDGGEELRHTEIAVEYAWTAWGQLE